MIALPLKKLCSNFILPCGENHYGFFLRCPTSCYNRPLNKSFFCHSKTPPKDSIAVHATKIIEAILQSARRAFYNFDIQTYSHRTLHENAAVPAGLRRPLPNSHDIDHRALSTLIDIENHHVPYKTAVHSSFRRLAIETKIAPKAFDRKSGSSADAFVGNSKQLAWKKDTYCAFS